MSDYKDYYKTLGVSKTATQDEIKKAFRKLAAKHHPDKNKNDPQAEQRFKEINEAYTVLSDPEKRQMYDQFGTTSGTSPFGGGRVNVDPSQFGEFSDFFRTLFGGSFDGGGGFPNSPPQRLEAAISVPVPLAYHGGATMISIEGRKIEVTLPKGTRNGSKLRLRGQAPSGGDLILTVNLEPAPPFKVEGDHVHVRVPVPDFLAVLGGGVRVTTLDGDVEMTLPAGIQSGRTLRLRGQGWPRKDGSRGDLLAEIAVAVPAEPTPEQLELYEQLRKLDEGVLMQ